GVAPCDAVAGAWPRLERSRRAGHADRPFSRGRALDRDARRKSLSSDLDHGRIGRAGGSWSEPVFASSSLFAAAVVLYASGNGIGTIARGTLPLALFGPARYPALMGRIARPIMFAMALSPFL